MATPRSAPQAGVRHPDAGHPATRDAALRRVAELAEALHRADREALLEAGVIDAPWDEESRALLDDAVRRALALGAAVDDVSRHAAPTAGRLGRSRAVGYLKTDCAVLAEVEDHLMTSSEQYGGEVPVEQASRLRDLRVRARAAVHVSVRRAVVSGMPARDILAAAEAVGLDLETTDIVVAFERVGD